MKDYIVTDFPKSRIATFDVGKLGSRKHQITGLIEVDVTDARKKIKTQLTQGRSAGFIPWLIKCIAATVAEDPAVQAINKGRNSQVIFSEVDVSLTLEREVGGQKVPLAAVVRNAGAKSIEELTSEITGFRNLRVESEKDFVLGDQNGGRLNKLFFGLPQWVRMIAWKAILGNPFIRKNSMGTVIITNVGLSGGVSGWILPKTMHNLAFGIGSIRKKPWVVNNEVAVREIMHLAVIFDHDAVDGAPAARFTSKLVKNIEKAAWLE